jgi:hypothetical protein
MYFLNLAAIFYSAGEALPVSWICCWVLMKQTAARVRVSGGERVTVDEATHVLLGRFLNFAEEGGFEGCACFFHHFC